MTTSATEVTTGLSPAQAKVLGELLRYAELNPVIVLRAGAGEGKTTLLERARGVLGGAMLTAKDLVEAMHGRHPLALEETLYAVLTEALRGGGTVFVDDLDVAYEMMAGSCRAYPRSGYVESPLKAVTAYAAAAGKRLIVAAEGWCGPVLSARAYTAGMDDFKEADYAALCGVFLGPDRAPLLEYGKIYRFAPRLNARQLKEACAWVAFTGAVATDPFVDYLRQTRMASNVHLGEVAQVTFDDLKGIDDILHALEANIILPLEDDALAQEMRIRPKRGVLIAGPPGTGKTTIGRALAHRLRGKFFLIDGTFISGTSNFYGRVHEVFEAAKENSPSVIFIDDSDVIFESGEEHGLYRYLLTMLDGLESESNARVCVMMTAMDVGNLPPALIRSGRVELWLETRLPDAAGRAQILATALADLPAAMGAVDVAPIAAATDGLTGADLRRLVDDGKILYAYDRSRGRTARAATDYFLAAVEAVRLNRDRYARAESQARQQRKAAARPPWFDVHTDDVA